MTEDTEYTKQEMARNALNILYGVSIANAPDKLRDSLSFYYDYVRYYVEFAVLPPENKE